MSPRFGNFSAEYLQNYIDRIETLEEEKTNIADDIKEVYAEAKGNGYDVKTMRQIIRLRKMEPSDREEMEHLLDTYKRALNMVTSGYDDDEQVEEQ